ncbi:MAG: ROK family protein [Hyphomicrobium sp.]|nr:ROK family protein [Hyphomicrobium sp.]
MPADNKSPENQDRNHAGLAQLRILSIDIGGTLIKASVINSDGEMLAPWVRNPTPQNATPDAVVAEIDRIAQDLPPYQKISVAFPGVVANGVVTTAPNLAANAWYGHDFRSTLQTKFGCDVRVLNDAIVQGLGVARGPGLECVLTLGTGLGFALFRDGRFLVQLELGQNGRCDGQNFDEYVGHAAFIAEGEEEWNRRVEQTFGIIRNLATPDRILVGGGNARRITFALPSDIVIFPMTAGITGGARLWGDHSNSSLAMEFA